MKKKKKSNLGVVSHLFREIPAMVIWTYLIKRFSMLKKFRDWSHSNISMMESSMPSSSFGNFGSLSSIQLASIS